jgi:hypothetical protein
MEKEFVPYDLSLRMKKLGFDEPCFGWYADETHLSIRPQYIQPNDPNNVYNWCLAPTFSQAFRWFREKYSIYGIILPSYADSKAVKDRFFYEVADGKKIKQELEYHTTHEEAELACLEKLIEIVEQKYGPV